MRLIGGDHDGFLPKSCLDDVCIFPKCYHARSTHPIGWMCQCFLASHSLMISKSSRPAAADKAAKFSGEGVSGMTSIPSQRRWADLQIGRASCREGVWIPEVAAQLNE